MEQYAVPFKQHPLFVTEGHESEHGWVMLTDKMGSDEACVKRARLSHNGEFRGWEREEQLLAFLMRHEHKSVFQAARMVVRAKIPLETVHEIDRHRTLDLHGDLYGSTQHEPQVVVTASTSRKFINKNEASGRYINLADLGARRIPRSRVGRKSKTNKQGTGAALPPEVIDQFLAEDNALKDAQIAHIKKWSDPEGADIAFEIVRGVMGLDNYTIIELDGDALWWMEFFRLRMAPGAKQEVREFANLCFKIFEELFPRVAKLFKEYTLNREVFAGSQAKALREMLRFLHSTSCEMPPQPGQLAVFVRGFGEKHGLSGGTLAEFVASLTKED